MKQILHLKALLVMLCVMVGARAWADETATLQYTAGTTTNMTGNNDAATVGLSATDWSVVSAKNSASNHIGLNKSNYLALYYNASGSNTLTVTNLSGNTITGIVITYTGETYNNASVSVDGTKVSDTDNSSTTSTHAINSTSFVVTNANTSNTQVRISKIEITYQTASASSVTAPTFSLAAGTYVGTQSLTLTADDGCDIYYTTDNSDPTTSETAVQYTSAISIAASTTVKAAAKDGSDVYSDVVTRAYTIEAPIANTKETAYTTAEAIALIDAGSSQLTSTQVYVKGTISKVSSYNSTYGSITYWLDSDAFEVYSGLNADGEKFTALTDIETDAEVVVYGYITKFNSTYEFKSNSWLVSYEVPAGVKATPEFSISGNETDMSTTDAANSFTVTYNGDGTLSAELSDPTVASVTVDGTTVTVTPLAAGTTFITVSAPETDNYKAASVKYTLTVTAPLTPASLPFSFDGGLSDIASTTGMSQSGLDSDYTSSPKLKFDTTGDYLIIYYGEAAKALTYTMKGNGFSGGTFDVLESADGTEYTTVASYSGDDSPKSTATDYTDQLKADSRYVKFIYTTKSNGNVALGDIKIAYKADPELDFDQDKYTFIIGNAMSVSATSAAGSTGAITYAITDGDENKISIDATTGVLTCTEAGAVIVTATIAETDDYASATNTCLVNVINQISYNSIIVATTTDSDGDEKYYAMTKDNSGSTYLGYQQLYKIHAGTLDYYVYNNLDTDPNNFRFFVEENDGNVTIQNPNDATYVQATAAKAVSFGSDAYSWTSDDDGVLTAANSSYGTLQYNTGSPRFTTYTSKSGQYAKVVNITGANSTILGAGYGRNVTKGNFGTICLNYKVASGEYTGMVAYTIDSKVVNAEGEVTAVVLKENPAWLIPGHSYIFQATSSTITCLYMGEWTDDLSNICVGMVGNISDDTNSLSVPEGCYVLSDNKLRKVNGGTATVGKYRAYIDLTNVKVYGSSAASARGLFFFDIETGEMTPGDDATAVSKILQNAAGTSATDASADAMYDLSGRRIQAQPSHGIYIQGGKKIIK